MSWRMWVVRRAAIAGAGVLLSGCATFPDDRLAECAARPPLIQVDRETGRAWTDVSVLTYNVEGLPWPARRNRSSRMREIGRQLGEMRASGEAPDIVLLQEAFTTSAGRLAEQSGYLSRIRGPRRGAERPATSDTADPGLTKARKLFKGERLLRLFSSGLYVLSDFPVLGAAGQPFRRRECAGFDCLANKGLQHVRIEVPGVPEPVELFNTHLNSASASRVGEARSLPAHNLQIEETARFIEQQRDPAMPMIFGGDFNMRNADERFAHFAQVLPYTLVHQYCADETAGCRVDLSWDGDAPWMDTQDLQGFDDSPVVKVRPIRVQGMFDEPWRGAPLADHDGLLVVYRLSWPADAIAASGSCQTAGPTI